MKKEKFYNFDLPADRIASFLRPVINFIKLFCCNLQRHTYRPQGYEYVLFVTCKTFKPNLMFAGKAGAYTQILY